MYSTLVTLSCLSVILVHYWNKICRWIRHFYLLMKIPKMPFSYWPFFGHILDLPDVPTEFFRKFQEKCHKMATESKEKIGVFWVGLRANIMLFHPDAAEVLLKSNVNIAKSRNYDYLRPWIRDGLITSTGGKWHQRRKLITPSFHFDVLNDFMCVMNEQTEVFVGCVEDAVGRERDEGRVDLQKMMELLTLDIMCETALGYQLGAQKDRHHDYVESVNMLVF